MEDRWRPCINVVRGSLALPGVVVLWTGLWTLLDGHVAGGLSVWKELGLSVLGAVLMVWTRTLFSNAGMDSLDRNGSLAEMSSLLAEGRLNWMSRAAFYGRSMIAIAASIMFWDGVYTICNNHGWPNTPTYNAICAFIGGVGMVWVVTTSEDDAAESEEDWDWDYDDEGVGSADVLGEVRAGRIEASRTPREGRDEARVFDEMDVMAKAGLYAKALFCNICTVVCWKGVEEGIEAGPDTNWTGLIFFVVGLSILACTQRLATNVGLDDELELDVELSAANSRSGSRSASAVRKLKKASRASLQRSRSSLMSSFDGVSGSGRGRDDKPWSFGVEKRSDDGEEHSSEWEEDGNRRRGCPRWVMTAAELVGVVFAWTGVEWYIWDGDYIPDTWIRDLVYIVVGVMTLLVTGTFFNLAGMISPMAVLKRVHVHNRHDELVPLLSSPRSAASNEERAWLTSPRHSPRGLGSLTR